MYDVVNALAGMQGVPANSGTNGMTMDQMMSVINQHAGSSGLNMPSGFPEMDLSNLQSVIANPNIQPQMSHIMKRPQTQPQTVSQGLASFGNDIGTALVKRSMMKNPAMMAKYGALFGA